MTFVRKRSAVLFFSAAFSCSVLACGSDDSSSTGSGGSSSDASTSGSNAGGGAATSTSSAGGGGAGPSSTASSTSSSSSTGAGGGEAAPIPACIAQCTADSECINLYADSHFACKDGFCAYKGCASDADCEVTNGPDFVCSSDFGGDVPLCYRSCATVADCDTGVALSMAANFSCESDKCRYTGCTSTEECQAAFNKPSYECATAFGNPLPTCYPTCASAADCVLANVPLYDVDNWACTDSKCQYLGCQSTQECLDTLIDPVWLCQ